MDMDHKLKMLNELKHRYSKRENIIKYLKSKTGEAQNSVSDILISYDLQAGSYIRVTIVIKRLEIYSLRN
ncbi:hypothetical protein HMSSN036_23890 [Paenibacillus macerans]|nr:hypothetical protein HMSSN036_23890 [Paenibacillus macerans]